MELPSNKVGLILIIVVLFVSGSILFSKIDFEKPTKPLESIELVIARNTSTSTSGNWLEEFNQTTLMRPTPQGPEVTIDGVDKDSITSKMSVDLFSEYLDLKQKGILSKEDEQALTEAISQKVAQEVPLDPPYTSEDFNTTQSTPLTVAIYGDRVAQIAIEHFLKMDSFKNMSQTDIYFENISKQHDLYIEQLKQITVPDVVIDAHVPLVNSLVQSKRLFITLSQADKDPAVSLVIVAQYRAQQSSEYELYTILSNYFKNNGIIFDTESTINFWKFFE